MSWYNELRNQVCPERPQLIECKNSNSFGILLVSNKSFFQQVVNSYQQTAHLISNNFVERTTTRLLNDLICQLKATGIVNDISSYNLDMAPHLHAQSLGHVSGMVEYLSPNDVGIGTRQRTIIRQKRLTEVRIDPESNLLSLTLHPLYGGWFGYRGLLVFHDIIWPQSLPRPEPLTFLTSEQRRSAILAYNLDPELGFWRDFNDPNSGKVVRYDAVQFAFFHERSIDRRRRILELLSEENQ